MWREPALDIVGLRCAAVRVPVLLELVVRPSRNTTHTKSLRRGVLFLAPLRPVNMPMSCGAAASTPRTKGRGATRGREAAPEPPLPVGGPGGSAGEAPQRLDQQVSEMNESYARKLRQFMAERASERLQSHRRVVQLEVQLEGAIAHRWRARGLAGPGPDVPTDVPTLNGAAWQSPG